MYSDSGTLSVETNDNSIFSAPFSLIMFLSHNFPIFNIFFIHKIYCLLTWMRFTYDNYFALVQLGNNALTELVYFPLECFFTI